MKGIYLSALPLSAKLFCTLFLVGIGCGSVAAFVQAATAVGLTPADVQASLAPEMPMMHMGHDQTSAEKEIKIDEISDSARVWMRTPLLIQTSHTHLFGQTLIAGLLGLIFLFTRMADGMKALLVSLPFVGTLLDIGGMWLTRFVSPSLAPVVIIGGSMFGAGYALITFISLYDLWLRKERTV